MRRLLDELSEQRSAAERSSSLSVVTRDGSPDCPLAACKVLRAERFDASAAGGSTASQSMYLSEWWAVVHASDFTLYSQPAHLHHRRRPRFGSRSAAELLRRRLPIDFVANRCIIASSDSCALNVLCRCAARKLRRPTLPQQPLHSEYKHTHPHLSHRAVCVQLLSTIVGAFSSLPSFATRFRDGLAPLCAVLFDIVQRHTALPSACIAHCLVPNTATHYNAQCTPQWISRVRDACTDTVYSTVCVLDCLCTRLSLDVLTDALLHAG